MTSTNIKSLAERLIEAQKDRLYVSHKESLSSAAQTLNSLVSKAPFLRQVISLQQGILKYENPVSQEAALSIIDLERIYAGVDKRTDDQAKNGASDTTLDYTDFIVLEVLKWYKNDFFKWTNEPETEHGKATRIGVDKPTAEEAKYQAGVVEVYRCEDGAVIRYPRYNDPVKLLETRNGRCGEWNNCFCLVLRSLGIRLRSVWNAEDHVWAEYYSDAKKRWIHLDSCEEAFDNPTLYNKGWGKKMSYVLAFDLDGAHDVSKRYVVEEDKSLPRDKISESDLREGLRLLTILQRRSLSKDDLYKVIIEDNVEDKELHGIKPSYTQTAEQPRQSGSVEWTTSRGEAGDR